MTGAVVIVAALPKMVGGAVGTLGLVTRASTFTSSHALTSLGDTVSGLAAPGNTGARKQSETTNTLQRLRLGACHVNDRRGRGGVPNKTHFASLHAAPLTPRT